MIPENFVFSVRVHKSIAHEFECESLADETSNASKECAGSSRLK
jgi:uncharacterized protein YecE (DUF72 family)